MHPLQIAISLLLLLSAFIVVLTAFQASTEVVPDLEPLVDKVYVEGRELRMVEAIVEEVRRLKPNGIVSKIVTRFLLKNAEEYLKFNIWGAAALEASRAYEVIKRLKF